MAGGGVLQRAASVASSSRRPTSSIPTPSRATSVIVARGPDNVGAPIKISVSARPGTRELRQRAETTITRPTPTGTAARRRGPLRAGLDEPGSAARVTAAGG